MSLAELAAKYDRVAAGAYPRALAVAAMAVTEAVEEALAPHRRTGAAAGALHVTPGAAGLEVEEIRYQRFIKGVPSGVELRELAVEGFNAAVRAELDAP